MDEEEAGISHHTSEEGDSLMDKTENTRAHVVVRKEEIKQSSLGALCTPCLAANHHIGEDPSIWTKLKHSLLCPPHGWVASWITYVLLVTTLWATAYVMFGRIALPGPGIVPTEFKQGAFFSVLVVVTLCLLGGWLVSLVGHLVYDSYYYLYPQVHLPPLLGMLVIGILLRNVPGVSASVTAGLDPAWSGILRKIALAVILLRAGLGLDQAALKKMPLIIFNLSFSPCVAETAVITGLSVLCLGVPWLWAAMIGFCLSAVSPAVVVPCLLALQSSGFGVDEGIPTLVMASASCNDVIAISAFTVILGITFNPTADVTMTSLQAPLEVIIGLSCGILWGLICTWFPSKSQPSTVYRVWLLGGGSLVALFGSNLIGFPGSGALAVLVMGFVAGVGWRGEIGSDSVPKVLAGFWIIFQPILFGLIGTEILIKELEPETIGWGFLILVCGLVIRFVVTYFSVFGAKLDHREKVFVSLAWIPKATVQAAIGPLALDMANAALINASENILEHDKSILDKRVELGKQLLTMAVLSILVTAPLGAFAIMTTGTRLLKKSKSML